MKRLKTGFISRMHRQNLTLQMGGEFGHLEPELGKPSSILITIGHRLGRLIQINRPRVPGRNLDAFVAEICYPSANVFEGVIGRLIAHELRQQNGRSLHRRHKISPRARQTQCVCSRQTRQARTSAHMRTAVIRRILTPPTTAGVPRDPIAS